MKKLFNWINNKIGSIRNDLIIHAGVSALLFILIFNILSLFIVSSIALLLWSTFITLSIGLIKEYYIDDIIRGTSADIKDLYADAVGIIIGVLISIPVLF